MRWRSVFKYSVLSFFSMVGSAYGTVFVAAPDASGQLSEGLYGALQNTFTEVLGEPVSVQNVSGWSRFNKQLLSNEYDVVLAEPHVIAFAISNTARLSMKVVARVPGMLKYYVIASDLGDIHTLQDLEGYRICALPSPAYSTALVQREYDNPLTLPDLEEVEGSSADIFARFKQGACKAAIVDEATWKQLQTSEPNLRAIFETEASPGMAIAVTSRIPEETRDILAQRLTSGKTGALIGEQLVKGLGQQGLMLKSNNGEYQKFDILPGLIRGW